jgi:hypothetical protein
MPNLIKQGEAKIVTKNGEIFVNIALELNIKLDGTNLQVVSGQGSSGGGAAQAQREDEKVSWQIPEFSSDKINFGK